MMSSSRGGISLPPPPPATTTFTDCISCENENNNIGYHHFHWSHLFLFPLLLLTPSIILSLLSLSISSLPPFLLGLEKCGLNVDITLSLLPRATRQIPTVHLLSFVCSLWGYTHLFEVELWLQDCQQHCHDKQCRREVAKQSDLVPRVNKSKTVAQKYSYYCQDGGCERGERKERGKRGRRKGERKGEGERREERVKGERRREEEVSVGCC